MIAETAGMSIRRQCDLFGFTRSTYYYELAPLDDDDLDLMDRIDKLYLDFPFLGSRRIRTMLNDEGLKVNRKRIQRLMRLMGIQAVYPKKNLSKPNEKDKKYPYLLRKLKIDRPNQVWVSDITYLRVGRGYAYLVAVMDWYSRKVLSWRLSTTVDTAFCLDALREAMGTYGTPEIFNTDQGCQFTSHEYTWTLEEREIQISHDSKGRAFDNIMIERLWRSVKYEDIFLKGYETMEAAQNGLGLYFRFYNNRRPHQGLNNRTPNAVYGCDKDLRKAG